MNSKIAIELQNTFGRFIQLYHLNRLDLAAPLFAENGHLWLPDRNIDAVGVEAVTAALAQMQAARIAKGVRRDVHIPHTPAYDTADNDTVGLGTWDVHSFDFTPTADETNYLLEYIYSRIDCKFVQEDGMWRFLELDWWDVGSFMPWKYDPSKDEGLWKPLSELPLPPAFGGRTTVHDFYAIQNVLTRYVHNNRKYAMEDAFADRDDISLRMTPLTLQPVRGRAAVAAELKRLDELEKKNIGKYIFVPASSSPVIEVSEDGEHADAQWMASCYSFWGEAFGITEKPYQFIRRAGLITASFVRQADQWRILSLDINILMALPALPYDSHCEPGKPANGKRYQRMGLSENRWKPALPKMGGDYPEDMPFIESRMAYWVNAYRRGEYMKYLDENMINDEHEIMFQSRMMGRCAPPVIGTDAMRERFQMGVFQYHHQQITNHGGMSPNIEISTDGRYATMSLFDMNTTAYIPEKNSNFSNDNSVTLNIPDDWNADNSGFDNVPCYLQFSVYQVAFAKVDGVWKHIKVDWETVGSLPDIYLAGKHSRGWAGAVTDVKYPALFEKYRYSPVRKLQKD